MKGEKWSNLTLPREVRRRAEAEMVWIPAGEKGTLVVLGGTAMTWNETTTNSVYSSSTVDNWVGFPDTLFGGFI